ncbi:MAG TPA: YihY/virulence factor BrkB family protein [Steroidobacteraceae bacterium]|nr:YihY/virulence factor BrkB family protein [Steroidobacteraceae bacterium]
MPLWELLRQTVIECNRHESVRLGASLAFYAVLSLAPIVILAIALAGSFVGIESAREQVLGQFQELLGPVGAAAVRDMIGHAQGVRATSIASALGLLTLLFGASQIFSELQSALDKIWEVDAARSSGILALVRQRFFSFGLVLAIGLMLLVSLLLSAALAAAGKFMGGALPLPEWMLQGFDFLLSVAGTSALFALIFHYIPDATTNWRDSWTGGLVTAALFSVGKTLIGLYLGKAGIGSAYGEAGSLVVVVVWVYYSSQIFFFGAELTHVLSQHRGTRNVKATKIRRLGKSMRPDSLQRATE